MNIKTGLIEYYPQLNPICGGSELALLLCYVAQSQEEKESWILADYLLIELNTGLNKTQIKKAINKLKKNQLLEEKRIDSKQYFRVNIENLQTQWNKKLQRQ